MKASVCFNFNEHILWSKYCKNSALSEKFEWIRASIPISYALLEYSDMWIYSWIAALKKHFCLYAYRYIYIYNTNKTIQGQCSEMDKQYKSQKIKIKKTRKRKPTKKNGTLNMYLSILQETHQNSDHTKFKSVTWYLYTYHL